ncbi:hypothetical protein BDV93DRAFT_528442 [Ceratobasidium sp. AG-I]|nr:hypothetical protein BDV93DRAFT_528442 [Ceratobasidium sp. AG-I]
MRGCTDLATQSLRAVHSLKPFASYIKCRSLEDKAAMLQLDQPGDSQGGDSGPSANFELQERTRRRRERAAQTEPSGNATNKREGTIYDQFKHIAQLTTEATANICKRYVPPRINGRIMQAKAYLVQNPMAVVALFMGLLAFWAMMREPVIRPIGCIHGTGNMCTPYWDKFKDERVNSYLYGLNRKDDFNAICESTPAIVDGKYYARPVYCHSKGRSGIYGAFDIPDKKCKEQQHTSL